MRRDYYTAMKYNVFFGGENTSFVKSLFYFIDRRATATMPPLAVINFRK